MRITDIRNEIHPPRENVNMRATIPKTNDNISRKRRSNFSFEPMIKIRNNGSQQAKNEARLLACPRKPDGRVIILPKCVNVLGLTDQPMNDKFKKVGLIYWPIHKNAVKRIVIDAHLTIKRTSSGVLRKLAI